MKRVYNFSAGPATLPLSILEAAQADLVNYQGSGQSVMEMSHRSAEFEGIIQRAESLLRQLLAIPDNYQVLFLQGGATLQFSMVAMNLSRGGKLAYINSGSWATKAMQEADQLGYETVELASSKADQFQTLPDLAGLDYSDYDYVHMTSNNTIYGTQFQSFPDTGETPLVVDMSSDFMSRPLDISQFGLIYAGAQKNLGPAGVTLVIIRDDLITDPDQATPTYLKYKTHADKQSLYNTPPTFAIYMVMLVLEWIDQQGGLEAIAERNQAQSDKLYSYLDQSPLFKNVNEPEARSLMNVTFTSGDAELDLDFVAYAKERGLINLKGHRSTGGLRASIYNAFPDEGIDHLIETLASFEEEKNV